MGDFRRLVDPEFSVQLHNFLHPPEIPAEELETLLPQIEQFLEETKEETL